MITFHLTAAQISALQCAGVEDGEHPAIALAWDVHSGMMSFEDAQRDELYAEVNERSNAEDAQAFEEKDPELRRAARRASSALAALAGKILRAKDRP